MSERIIYKKCPLCNEQEINFHKTGNCSEHPLYNNKISSNIVWKECEKCNHVFTEGYYSEKSLELIFSKTNKVQKVGGPVEKNRHISSRIIEKIIPSISSGIWLDVGFGNGSLLFTAKEYGFRPIGLDLRKKNVDQIKYLGIETKIFRASEQNVEGSKSKLLVNICKKFSATEYLSTVGAKDYLEKDFTPIGDMRASKEYRLEVAKNLLIKCFVEINTKKLTRVI